MENYQLITIIGANLLVFLSFMGAVIALHIHGNTQTNKRIDAIQQEMKDFHSKYMEETKSFHARLCEIEVGRRKNDK